MTQITSRADENWGCKESRNCNRDEEGDLLGKSPMECGSWVDGY